VGVRLLPACDVARLPGPVRFGTGPRVAGPGPVTLLVTSPKNARPSPRRVVGLAVALGAFGAAATALAWHWDWDSPHPLLNTINRRAAVTASAALTVLMVSVSLAASLTAPGRWRWLAVVATALLWWLAVERFAAPHLAQKLRLQQYYFSKDPDHWPISIGAEGNEDFLRGTPPAREFTPETVNVLFLGDSFTYGNYVAHQQAFPKLVGDRLRTALPGTELRVANFGWTSSSPLLSYRRLLAVGERYHPDVVVLCIDMTDFGDDIRWANVIEKNRVYWLYDKLPITLRAAQACAPKAYERFVAWTVDAPARRFFHSEAPLEETRRHMQPLVDNVAKIRAWCAARGADFVLVALPRSYQHSAREAPANREGNEYEVLGPYALEPFKLFDELRARGEYPVWSLLEAFQTTEVFPVCFEHDPHWTPAGHQVAADALAPPLIELIRAR
jgi:lysophospholipase L1-like esterase